VLGQIEASLRQIGAALAVEVATEEFDFLGLGVRIFGGLEEPQLDEAPRRFGKGLRGGSGIVGDFFCFVDDFSNLCFAVLFAITLAETGKGGAAGL
jgi:hypothetical protein